MEVCLLITNGKITGHERTRYRNPISMKNIVQLSSLLLILLSIVFIFPYMREICSGTVRIRNSTTPPPLTQPASFDTTICGSVTASGSFEFDGAEVTAVTKTSPPATISSLWPTFGVSLESENSWELITPDKKYGKIFHCATFKAVRMNFPFDWYFVSTSAQIAVDANGNVVYGSQYTYTANYWSHSFPFFGTWGGGGGMSKMPQTK